MPTRVRLVHRFLADRYHVYTSPDVRGFHVAMDTKAAAKWAAVELLGKLAELDGTTKPDFTFEDENALQAA